MRGSPSPANSWRKEETEHHGHENADPRHGQDQREVWEPEPYDKPDDGSALVQIHLEEDYSGDNQGYGVAESLWAQLAEDAASTVGIVRVTGSIRRSLRGVPPLGPGDAAGRDRVKRVVRCAGSGTGQLIWLARGGRPQRTA